MYVQDPGFVVSDERPSGARHIPEAPAAELYDLQNDPGEQTDLADQHPSRVQRMTGQLEEWFLEVDTDRRRQLTG